MEIQYPVFVRAKDDGNVRMISVDRQTLWNYYEQIDVENEEFEAWDTYARPLRLMWDEQKGTRPLMISSESESSKLSDALVEYARIFAPQSSGVLKVRDKDFAEFYSEVNANIRAASISGRLSRWLRKRFCRQH